mgnify:CR=1 FL=1
MGSVVQAGGDTHHGKGRRCRAEMAGIAALDPPYSEGD